MITEPLSFIASSSFSLPWVGRASGWTPAGEKESLVSSSLRPCLPAYCFPLCLPSLWLPLALSWLKPAKDRFNLTETHESGIGCLWPRLIFEPNLVLIAEVLQSSLLVSLTSGLLIWGTACLWLALGDPPLWILSFFYEVSLPCSGIPPGEYYLKQPWADIPPAGCPSGQHTPWTCPCGDAVIPQQSPLLWCHISLQPTFCPWVRHPSTVSSKSRDHISPSPSDFLEKKVLLPLPMGCDAKPLQVSPR